MLGTSERAPAASGSAIHILCGLNYKCLLSTTILHYPHLGYGVGSKERGKYIVPFGNKEIN